MFFIKKFNKMFSKYKFSGISLQKNNRNTYCLISLNYGKVNTSELEAAKKILKKIIKKQGKILIRVFPKVTLTKKPLQARMGRGKGKFFDFVCFVVPGSVLFEVSGLSVEKAKKALLAASLKFSITSKVYSFLEIFG